MAKKKKEATRNYYKEFWEKQKIEDPEAYAAHQKSLGKTGKVEEPALPQSSEKPVASKKKEPDYIPSQSEKDWQKGKWATPKQIAADKKKATKPMKPEEMDQLLADVTAAGGSYKLEDGRASDPKKVKAKPAKAEKAKAKIKPAKAEKQFGKVDVTPVAAPIAAPASAPATTQVPRSDSSGNTVDVSRFAGPNKMDAITDAAEKEQQNYLQSDEGKKIEADAAEARTLAAMPVTEAAPTESKKSGGPLILNTDKTGESAPVTGTKSQAKGTAAVNRMRRDRNSSIRPYNTVGATSAKPAGSSTFYDFSDSDLGIAGGSPAKEGKPTMSSRVRGFFGGDVKPSAPAAPTDAPDTSAPTSRSTPPPVAATPAAPSYSRTQFFSGGHNVNQQGLGGQNINAFNDNTGGGYGGAPGKGGTGSINNNYSTVQANVGDGNVYGNVKGATVGAPTVASTSGKASSTNKNANVLSTGGPAAHVRAPNAARTSRPTNNKANPRTKNP